MNTRRNWAISGISPGRALALVGAVIFIAATIERWLGIDQTR